MNIIAYLKPTCGWSMGVRAIMKKYDLNYEDRDIINNPDQYDETLSNKSSNNSDNFAKSSIKSN